MNGADRLCDTLLANEVDVCFANPGTSEMHFVAALDRKPNMRCVLGLFEGVVTGAADGYARMADKPAATLLHLGPGLANGLANMHNARRARTPMLNVVGDHASYHLQHDAPLTSDIESLARPMSHWVGRVTSPQEIEEKTNAAYVAAMRLPGVATLILPGDSAWGDLADTGPARPANLPAQPMPGTETIIEVAKALHSGKRVGLLLTGKALRAPALRLAGRIAQATGARIFAQTSNGRIEGGRGRVSVARVPYPVDLALDFLRDIDVLVLVGSQVPVAFFAYPGKPGRLIRDDCDVLTLAEPGQDLHGALTGLADELGARTDLAERPAAPHDPLPTSGTLDADAVASIVAGMLPDNSIICDEAITSGRNFHALVQDGPQHDYLQITGGAIGIGIPMATGAAVACPGRKVIAMQADGSGMYTVQGLWSQARENLDVLTIILSNRAYAVLIGEMRNVGVNQFGANASRMLKLDKPDLDWVSMARGMGVEGGRADTIEAFTALMKAGLSRRGPFLIEAVI